MKKKDVKIEITSLEGAPSKIGFDMINPSNVITSLEGAPSKIGFGDVTFGKSKKVNSSTDDSNDYNRTMSDYISLATIDGAASSIF